MATSAAVRARRSGTRQATPASPQLGTVSRRDRHRSHHRRRTRRRPGHLRPTTAGCSTPGTVRPERGDRAGDAAPEPEPPGAVEIDADARDRRSNRGGLGAVGGRGAPGVDGAGRGHHHRRPAGPAVDTHDVYLRLHLLSHRLVQPNTINLDGIFGLLPTVAWTQLGPGRRRGPPGRPAPGPRRRARRCWCARSTSSPACSTTSRPPGCGSPTPAGCASAPTWPRAPP